MLGSAWLLSWVKTIPPLTIPFSCGISWLSVLISTLVTSWFWLPLAVIRLLPHCTSRLLACRLSIRRRICPYFWLLALFSMTWRRLLRSFGKFSFAVNWPVAIKGWFFSLPLRFILAIWMYWAPARQYPSVLMVPVIWLGRLGTK